MKPLKEEKKGSLINKFVIITVLVLSSLIKAQSVSLFDIIKIPKGYSKFKSVYTEPDSGSKIILYGNKDKNITIVNNPDRKGFSVRETFFFYPISDLENIKLKNRTGNDFIFLSRMKKICGIFSLTKYDNLRLLSQTYLDEFYDNLIVGDFNKDGKEEALLYGGISDGITLVEEKNFLLKETKVLSGVSFTFLKTIDFNFDDYIDLIGIDNLSNKLVFIQNFNNFYFKIVRNIELPSEVHFFDLTNGEEFKDIIYSTNNMLCTVKADSVYSFNNKYEYYFPNKGLYKAEIFGNELLYLNNKGDLVNANLQSGSSSCLLSAYKVNDFKFLSGRLLALSEKGYLFVSPPKSYNDFYITFSDSVKLKGITGNSLLISEGKTTYLLNAELKKIPLSFFEPDDTIYYNNRFLLKTTSHKIEMYEQKEDSLIFKSFWSRFKYDSLLAFNYNDNIKIIYLEKDSLFIFNGKSHDFISKKDELLNYNENEILFVKDKFVFSIKISEGEKSKRVKYKPGFNYFILGDLTLTVNDSRLKAANGSLSKSFNLPYGIKDIQRFNNKLLLRLFNNDIYILDINSSVITKLTSTKDHFFVTKFLNNKFYVIFPELNNRTIRFMELE